MDATVDDYEFFDEPGGERLRLTFSGPFEGRAQVWRAEFVTLAACYSEWLGKNGLPPGTPVRLRAFIEIGAASGAQRELRVALPVARIDRASALKAMVMVRNYRRLRPGRIEFGEEIPFPAAAAK